MRLFLSLITLSLLLPTQKLSAAAVEPCKPVELRCEYLINPLGIDATSPRLTWRLADIRMGAYQKAYQLLVSNDSLSLLSNKMPLWNTGQVITDKTNVIYKGVELKPRTKYFWKIYLWDKDNRKTASSAIASFETG